jgi:4-aminobutyrate aminotransferase-like enzyme
MAETRASAPAAGGADDPFHLTALDAVAEATSHWATTCLDPGRDLTDRTPADHLSRHGVVFTSGGSHAREIWAETALGTRIQGSRASTDTPIELLDLCSMTCNTILGVNDPWVKLKQAAYLLSEQPHHLPARIASDLTYRVAHRILERLDRFGSPGSFVINLRQCNGSDAVELALHAAWRAARAEPGRRRLVTFEGSYHGESIIASLVCKEDRAVGLGRALLDRVDNVDHHPSPTCGDGGYLSPEALATLDALDRDGDQYFAVLIEPIQWRNSVHAVPLEFLRRLREVCTRRSICLIFDEVQNAFGYTGSIFFAETSGVCPDIIATGKALTSGHGALGIVVARAAYRDIEAPFGSKTNAGEMLSLVAVDAVMDRLTGVLPSERDSLPPWLPPGLAADLKTGLLATAYPRVVGRVDDLERRLRLRYPTLIGPSTGIGLVRGLCLLDGAGQPSGPLAAEVSEAGLRHGVYVRRAGAAVYLKPSLATSASDVDLGVDRLSATFDEVLAVRAEASVA